MKHTVLVWDKPQVVTAYQKSNSVCVATGEYMGKSIETKDRSEGAAVKRWVEAAHYKGPGSAVSKRLEFSASASKV